MLASLHRPMSLLLHAHSSMHRYPSIVISTQFYRLRNGSPSLRTIHEPRLRGRGGRYVGVELRAMHPCCDDNDDMSTADIDWRQHSA
jgi:hypothetical protein